MLHESYHLTFIFSLYIVVRTFDYKELLSCSELYLIYYKLGGIYTLTIIFKVTLNDRPSIILCNS